MQLKRFYASLDGSVRQEMLLCSWKQFYASLDRSVRQEMLLCSWERLCTSLDRSVRQETLSCRWKRFYANMDRSVQKEMVLCGWNQIYATDCWQELHFEFSRSNLNRNVQSPSICDDSSHSQGQSGKRLLLASRGHPIRSVAYQATSSDPPDQTHT